MGIETSVMCLAEVGNSFDFSSHYSGMVWRNLNIQNLLNKMIQFQCIKSINAGKEFLNYVGQRLAVLSEP